MSSKKYKYNYILFDSFKPTYNISKLQYARENNVIVLNNGLIRGGGMAQFFHKAHWSAKINRVIRLPLKKIWYKRMTKAKFNNSLPICYVFYSGQYCCQDRGICDYIKKLNLENRIVAYLTDIYAKEHFDVLKKNCDLVVTYDRAQAELNSVEYFDPYAYNKTQSNQVRIDNCGTIDDFKQDLYFIGYAKDRLEKIFDIYRHLTKNNVRCLFQLAGVPKNQRIKGVGLVYLEKDLPYEEVLQNVRESRCVLEVSQSGASGKTLRTQEAILLRRKLLTDRIATKEENAFSDAQLAVFNLPEEIDVEFLKSNSDYDKCLNPDVLSTTAFLDFLEEKLL